MERYTNFSTFTFTFLLKKNEFILLLTKVYILISDKEPVKSSGAAEI